jgi:hypothetical protein
MSRKKKIRVTCAFGSSANDGSIKGAHATLRYKVLPINRDTTRAKQLLSLDLIRESSAGKRAMIQGARADLLRCCQVE